MRPTVAWMSKASRLPLNSKKANKDFYKGTRTGNIMARKRIVVANRNTGEELYDKSGRVRTWNLKTHRIDENRVTSYVVPPGLAESTLHPLVFLGSKEKDGMDDRPRAKGYPGAGKMQPGSGLDADYYERLRPSIWERRGLSGEEDGDRRSGGK